MTVSSVDRQVSYTATGITYGPFPVTFPFFEIDVSINGVIQAPTAYTITQTAPGLSGTVLFVVPPVGTVTITGNTVLKQQTDFISPDAVEGETLERALDRLTMIALEQQPTIVVEGVVGVEFVTTTVTKTVHGASPDFDNLYQAAAWLDGVTFGAAGAVIFDVRAGIHDYNAPVLFRHGTLHRVTIQGAPMTGTLSPTELPCTGTALSADRTAQLTLLRTKYSTEIRFAGANGWMGFVGNLPLVKRLLVTSDRTPLTGVSGLMVFNDGAILSEVSVHGSGGLGFSCRAGFFLLKGPNTCSASGCVSSGIGVAGAANMVAEYGPALVSNDVAGAHMIGGKLNPAGGGCYVMGNGSGVYITHAGSLESSAGFTCTRNGVDINVNHGDALFATPPFISVPGSTHVVYAKQARITMGATNLASGNVTALSGSIIDLTGATNPGTLSPSANTVGNTNSYTKV